MLRTTLQRTLQGKEPKEASDHQLVGTEGLIPTAHKEMNPNKNDDTLFSEWLRPPLTNESHAPPQNSHKHEASQRGSRLHLAGLSETHFRSQGRAREPGHRTCLRSTSWAYTQTEKLGCQMKSPM
nr:hypothetical protein HJG63_010706 [Rousettus aegyptiacus]